MAVIGIGTDLTSIERWQRMCERHPGALERLLTPREAERPVHSQAARWAAKEALAKALGAPSGLSWHDAEVVTDATGAPHFEVRGSVAARCAELGVTTIHLSITHDAGLASAFVVCES